VHPGQAPSVTPAPPLSLAASVSSLNGNAAKEEKADTVPSPANEVPAIASSIATPVLQPRGDAWFLDLEGREYRVGGLEKTIGTDALKITLRLRAGERFHLDQVDL